jgi:hypothetical protein
MEEFMGSLYTDSVQPLDPGATGVVGINTADPEVELDVNGSVKLNGKFITQDPWFDVRAYNAKGDGVTDDTAAIQSALDAAADLGGGTVFLPAGTYVITSSLVVGTYVILAGAGSARTMIDMSSAQMENSAGITSTYVYNPCEPTSNQDIPVAITLRGFAIIGSNAQCPWYDGKTGIYLTANGCTMEQVEVWHCRVGIRVRGWNNYVSNCRILSCNKGFDISWSSDDDPWGDPGATDNDASQGTWLYGCYYGSNVDTVAIQSYDPSSGVYTTDSPHGFAEGDSVYIAGCLPAGFNGLFTVETADPLGTTFTLATNNPESLSQAGIASLQESYEAYAPGWNIATATHDLENNLVEFVTLADHGFKNGDTAVISGCSNGSTDFDGTYCRINVINDQAFQVHFSSASQLEGVTSAGIAYLPMIGTYMDGSGNSITGGNNEQHCTHDQTLRPSMAFMLLNTLGGGGNAVSGAYSEGFSNTVVFGAGGSCVSGNLLAVLASDSTYNGILYLNGADDPARGNIFIGNQVFNSTWDAAVQGWGNTAGLPIGLLSHNVNAKKWGGDYGVDSEASIYFGDQFQRVTGKFANGLIFGTCYGDGNSFRWKNYANESGTPVENLELMTLDGYTGNLGIGNTSPSNSLSVAGGASIGFGASDMPAPENGLLVYGQIGVGTDSPEVTLDVYGSAKVNAPGGSTTAFQVVQDTCAQDAVLTVDTTSPNVQLGLNVNSLTPTVGQGDITHVATSLFGNTFLAAGSDDPSVNLILQSEPGSSGRIFWQRPDSVLESWGRTGQIEVFPDQDTLDGGHIHLQVFNAGGEQLEALVITSSGNVGIGNTTPGSRLSVNGLPSSSSGLTQGDIWVDTANGNVLRIVS